MKAVIDTNVLIKTVKRSNPEFAIYVAFDIFDITFPHENLHQNR